MNQSQRQVIDYLREEYRVLREQLGDYASTGHLGNSGQVQRWLGGMVNYYYRAAA